MDICWESADLLSFHLFSFFFMPSWFVCVPFSYDVWGRMWSSIELPFHLLCNFDRRASVSAMLETLGYYTLEQRHGYKIVNMVAVSLPNYI